MKRVAYPALGLLLVLLAVPSRSAAKTKIELKDAQGKSVGDVVIWDQGTGLGLQLDLHDLTPGEHAIHFHQVPKCEGPGFQIGGWTLQP